MAKMTVTTLGEKVDRVAAGLDGLTEQVGALTGRVDVFTHRVETLTGRVDVLTVRFDEHERSNEREFQAIQVTFVEMRAAVAGQIGDLRTDMIGRFDRVDQRFDRVDRRFDRIEDKLDRALGARGKSRGPRRGNGK